MNKDEFLSHIYSKKETLGSQIDVVETWQKEKGIKNMSFLLSVPCTFGYCSLGQDKNRTAVTIKRDHAVQINIDGEGKIDFGLRPSVMKEKGVSLIMDHDTSVMVYSTPNHRRLLTLADFANNFFYDRKGNEFLCDESSYDKDMADVCRLMILPLINEQLRTKEEKHFSRNGLDILIETSDALRGQDAQGCNYIDYCNMDLLLNFSLGDVLGRPGDKTLTKHTILSGKNNKVKGIPKTVNKLPLFIGSVVRDFCKLFPEEYVSTMMSKENLALVGGMVKVGNCRSLDIFRRLYYSNVKEDELVYDYLRRCMKYGWKADITLARNKSTALDKMMEANNESFARELREHPSEDNNLNVRRPYRELAEKYLPDKFRLLTTRDELIMEATRQRNCLARLDYSSKVNSGECVIFTTEEPKHCTIEVNLTKKPNQVSLMKDRRLENSVENTDISFTCKQFLAFDNSNPPEVKQAKEKFDKLLQEVSEQYNATHKHPTSKRKSTAEKEEKKREREEISQNFKSKQPDILKKQHNRYSSLGKY